MSLNVKRSIPAVVLALSLLIAACGQSEATVQAGQVGPVVDGDAIGCAPADIVEPTQLEGFLDRVGSIETWVRLDGVPADRQEGSGVDIYDTSTAIAIEVADIGRTGVELSNPEEFRIGPYFRDQVDPLARRLQAEIHLGVTAAGNAEFVWLTNDPGRAGGLYVACGWLDGLTLDLQSALTSLGSPSTTQEVSKALGILLGRVSPEELALERQDLIDATIKAEAERYQIEIPVPWTESDPATRVISDAPDEVLSTYNYTNVNVRLPAAWEGSDELLCTRVPSGWNDCTTMRAVDPDGLVSLDVQWLDGESVAVILLSPLATTSAPHIALGSLAESHLRGGVVTLSTTVLASELLEESRDLEIVDPNS